MRLPTEVLAGHDAAPFRGRAGPSRVVRFVDGSERPLWYEVVLDRVLPWRWRSRVRLVSINDRPATPREIEAIGCLIASVHLPLLPVAWIARTIDIALLFVGLRRDVGILWFSTPLDVAVIEIGLEATRCGSIEIHAETFHPAAWRALRREIRRRAPWELSPAGGPDYRLRIEERGSRSLEILAEALPDSPNG